MSMPGRRSDHTWAVLLRRIALPAVVGTVLLASACSLVRAPVGTSAPPGTTGPVAAWKVVQEKRPPNLLLAGDRSECTVSEERFAEVEEGDRVLCQWRSF